MFYYTELNFVLFRTTMVRLSALTQWDCRKMQFCLILQMSHYNYGFDGVLHDEINVSLGIRQSVKPCLYLNHERNTVSITATTRRCRT